MKEFAMTLMRGGGGGGREREVIYIVKPEGRGILLRL